MNLCKKTYIVETDIVATKDEKFTFDVTKRLKGVEGEKGVLVLLYPTRTFSNALSNDSTLNHIVSHMQDLGLNEIKILNLFSTVTDGKLSAKGLNIDMQNLEYINSIMKSPTFKEYKFIIAWGSSLATSIACKKTKAKILEMYKTLYPKGNVYQLISSNSKIRTDDVVHPLYLGIRDKNSLWSLAEYHISDKLVNTETKNPLKIVEKKGSV